MLEYISLFIFKEGYVLVAICLILYSFISITNCILFFLPVRKKQNVFFLICDSDEKCFYKLLNLDKEERKVFMENISIYKDHLASNFLGITSACYAVITFCLTNQNGKSIIHYSSDYQRALDFILSVFLTFLIALGFYFTIKDISNKFRVVFYKYFDENTYKASTMTFDKNK